MVLIDQVTGNRSDILIEDIHSHGNESHSQWLKEIKKLGPQVFTNWVIKNLSSEQNEMLSRLKAFWPTLVAPQGAVYSQTYEKRDHNRWSRDLLPTTLWDFFPSMWDLIIRLTTIYVWGSFLIERMYPKFVMYGVRKANKQRRQIDESGLALRALSTATNDVPAGQNLQYIIENFLNETIERRQRQRRKREERARHVPIVESPDSDDEF